MPDENSFHAGEHIGLFFGSFNPIHMGHLIVAQYMVSFSDVDRVCFVVSPQNPFKKRNELAPGEMRFKMVSLAVEDNPDLLASDVEFDLPLPSYTIDTLNLLTSAFPDVRFTLILGSDNLQEIREWKDASSLLDNYGIYVYLRPGYEEDLDAGHENIRIFNAPSLHISSTHIRSCLHEGKSIRYLVPDRIVAFIKENKLYLPS